MKQIKAKLGGSRGETLVETLAAILVAALSVGLLLGGVAVSVQLNRQAEESDRTFYDTLTAAENRTAPVTTTESTPSVTVEEGEKSASIPVQVYGGEGLWSYALKDDEGGDGS